MSVLKTITILQLILFLSGISSSRILESLQLVSSQSTSDTDGVTFTINYAGVAKPEVVWTNSRKIPVVREDTDVLDMENQFNGSHGQAVVHLQVYEDSHIRCSLTAPSREFFLDVKIPNYGERTPYVYTPLSVAVSGLSVDTNAVSPGLSLDTDDQPRTITFTNSAPGVTMRVNFMSFFTSSQSTRRGFEKEEHNTSESQSVSYTVPPSVRGVAAFHITYSWNQERRGTYYKQYVFVNLHPTGVETPYRSDELTVGGLRTGYSCSERRPCLIRCEARGNNIQSVSLLKGNLNLAVEEDPVDLHGEVIRLKYQAYGMFVLPSGNATSGLYKCRAIRPGHYRDSRMFSVRIRE